MLEDRKSPAHLALGKPADDTDLIIRRRYRLACRRMPPRGGTLLDYGCGNGAQTLLFAPHFSSVVGIDVGVEGLGIMRARTAEGDTSGTVLPVHYDGDTIPLARASVDYAIAFEVLEHVPDDAAALAELSRVVRPGGHLVLSVPNRWWLFETHGAELPLLPWNRVPFFSWLPRRVHDRFARARIYRRRDIMAKVEASHFDVVQSTYITAPMDVVRSVAVQRLLRRTVFRGDETRVPMLATSIMILATRS